MMSRAKQPTGQQILDWLDAHADQFGPLAKWQREIVKLWGDGWSYLPSRRWGVQTVRGAFVAAHQALTSPPAEPAPAELGSGASMGRGIVWSELAAEIHRDHVARASTGGGP